MSRLVALPLAPLLLFGSLWLIAGLLNRGRDDGPTAIPLLVALSGATIVALAQTGPAVFTGMLIAGYGFYAVMASEGGDTWRRPARALIVLLVASDLVIFEILLHAAAHPLSGIGAGSAMMTIVAVVLRGGMAPAHIWQPPALSAVSAPTALLLSGAPAGVALIGGDKLVASSDADITGFCLAIALGGALWSTVGGLGQRRPLPTLGYAAAAGASLLLVTLAPGPVAGATPWLVLSLLASCSAVVVIGLLHAGPARNSAITAVVALHGLCSGHAALLAAQGLSAASGFLVSVIAVLASLLLTLAVRRTPERRREGDSAEAALHAFGLVVVAAVGLGYAWSSVGIGFASLWPAPVGISLGLMLFRFLPPREEPRIAPGDVLGPIERAGAWSSAALAPLWAERLPRYRDRAQQRLIGLWHGQAWAERITRLEPRLGVWSATAVLLLLVAITGTILLVS